MVAVSTIGAATAAMYSGSRVTFTTARDGNMIGTLSLLHNKFQTPIMALIVQVNHIMLIMEKLIMATNTV